MLILKYKMRAADQDFFAVYLAGDPVRHKIFDPGMVFVMFQAALLCLFHHGIGYGMREMLLKACGQPEHFTLVITAKGDDLRHLRAGVCQSSRLIEYDDIGGCHRLQKFYRPLR